MVMGRILGGYEWCLRDVWLAGFVVCAVESTGTVVEHEYLSITHQKG